MIEFVEANGETGATAEQLRELFVDKVFLQNVLSILNKAKLVMRTGVGDLTFVHWKYIKPWIINTYHLKRLDRVSLFAYKSAVFPPFSEKKRFSFNFCILIPAMSF